MPKKGKTVKEEKYVSEERFASLESSVGQLVDMLREQKEKIATPEEKKQAVEVAEA